MWLHYPNIISSSLPNAILLHWYLSKKWCKDLFHGLLLQPISLCIKVPGPHGGLQPLYCCRNNMAKHKKSKQWLESINDNFLLLVMEGPDRKAVLLDLKLGNREGLAAEVKAQAIFIAVITGSWNSVLLEEQTALGLRRVSSSLFRNLLWRASCEHALQRRKILERQYSVITSPRLKTSAWWAKNSCQNSNLGRR